MEEGLSLRTAAEPSQGLCTGHVYGSQLIVKKKKPPRGRGQSHLLEHLAPLYRGKPKAVSVCVVIASSTAVALDEGGAPELLQT